jgi:nicotinate-nucleotide adenylyltransferase
MRIGVYGGTFDPPHMGHMESARAAVEILKLDKLLFVPARIPPHKNLPLDAAGPEARLEMTALLADGLDLGDRAEVLDLELRRQGKSYTSDTLEELHARFPGDELFLLMGGDMFLSLQTWHEPERIMELAVIAAFARTGAETGAALNAQKGFLSETYGARVMLLELPQILEISSTGLRNVLGAGKGTNGLWLPVYGYILKHGLYGTHADLKRLTDDELRAVSYSMIKAKRIPHVRGTEKAAVELARRWGADPKKARRAAILHDCTKYLNIAEQLKLYEKYDILLDSLERRALKLIHSKTGAALAGYVFGEPEDVCEAIRWHTTGKADMTTLEKVIYLADYIEPNRDFEGVEDLRALAEKDLDAAVTLGLRMTVREMDERGLPVHPNTLRALEWLKGS